jgi:hypothetical protein
VSTGRSIHAVVEHNTVAEGGNRLRVASRIFSHLRLLGASLGTYAAGAAERDAKVWQEGCPAALRRTEPPDEPGAVDARGICGDA